MRTLHVGLRVAHLDRSLRFYRGLGYEVVGEVPETGIGHLVMLGLPDDEFVSLELVHDPAQPPAGTGLSHLVVQVESVAATIAGLAGHGITAEPPTSPDGTEDFWTAYVVDPDGHRIELVQWPAGHAAGMSVADFPETS